MLAINGVPGLATGFPTGYGEKLSCSQAEPGLAINSALAYFSSISGGAFCGQTTMLSKSQDLGPRFMYKLLTDIIFHT